MAGSNGRAKRHFFGGTGLYIALFLGVTALAVAGYWTLLPKNTTDKDAENVSSQVELPVQDETPQMPEAELPQEAAKPAEPVEEPPEDLIVMDEATGVEDTVPAMESETDAQPVAPRLVVAPLVGEEVAAFSVDELTYNETLGDWRTHDGIDLAALAGEPVPPLPPLAERCDALVRQIERSAEFRNEKVALLEARRHYCWYLKGVKYANYYKDQINHMETLEDLYRVTAGIKRDLSD